MISVGEARTLNLASEVLRELEDRLNREAWKVGSTISEPAPRAQDYGRTAEAASRAASALEHLEVMLEVYCKDRTFKALELERAADGLEAEKVRHELHDDPSVDNPTYGRLVQEAAEADDARALEGERPDDDGGPEAYGPRKGPFPRGSGGA